MTVLKTSKLSETRILPLSALQAGQSGKVLEIEGGWHLRRRLNQIGIHVGDQLQVVRGAMFGGPVLIRIHFCEIALGKGMADRIIVKVNEFSK